MKCENEDYPEHDFDETGQCVFCGKNKLTLCYEELYGIIKEFNLSEIQKEAISFIISYSNGVNEQLAEVLGEELTPSETK